MRTFRCLLVLPMLSSVAMRPSLELEHQAVAWKWSDPCAKHNAKQTSKWWHSKTVCECIGDLLTSSSCSTPLKKSFDPKDEQDDCSCEDPCVKHNAESKAVQSRVKRSGWRTICECTGDFLTNHACSAPLEKRFGPEDELKGCSCEEVPFQRQAVASEDAEDPCKRFGATRERRSRGRSTECRCMDGRVTSPSCSEPGYPDFYAEHESKGCRCRHDPCSRFGAYLPEREGKLCSCLGYTVANSTCSRPGAREFPLEGNGEGCECVEDFYWAKNVPNPVKASALAFCEAAVRDYRRKPSASRVPSVETCQSLVAGLPHSSQGLSSEFKTAEELSEHPSARGLGRLDPLVHKKPTAMWHLQQVCRDECEELVNTTRRERWRIDEGMTNDTPIPPFMGCAERVVKKVEAEMLGCCGRSCGWNGHTCMAWPFIEEKDKVDWLEECCTEYNVLKGSKRELMCNSVLNARDAGAVSANDTSQEGADVGGAFLGQDSQLLWTAAGVESWLGKKYSYLDPKPTDGGQVPELLLALEPNVRREALQEKWFRETRTEIEPASLIQLQDDQCGEKDMNTCHKDFRTSRIKSCAKQKGWKYTSGTSKHLSDESRSKLKQQVPEYQATSKSPSDCTVLESYGSDWKMEEVRHFLFEYTNVESKEVSKKWSIRCFMETTKDKLSLMEEPMPLNSPSKKAQKAVNKLNFDSILYWVEASTR